MTVEGEHGSEVRVRGGKRHSGREESTELSFSRAGSLCREAGRQGARETIAANMCVPQYQQRADPDVNPSPSGLGLSVTVSRLPIGKMGKAEQESSVTVYDIKPFIHIARPVKSSVTLFWRTSGATTAAQRSPNTNTHRLSTPSARATRHTMIARRQ